MREAYFHEDDYRQIELVCDENLEWYVEQAARIEQFADNHRAGAGWTDMYVPPETPVPLAARGITIENFADAVTPLLPPFDAVTTGFSTTIERVPNARAFGNDPEIIVFAKAGQEIISAIWITLQPTDAAKRGCHEIVSKRQIRRCWMQSGPYRRIYLLPCQIISNRHACGNLRSQRSTRVICTQPSGNDSELPT
jgi:hypothetical protein